MESTDLYLEHDKVYIFDSASQRVTEVDYDGIEVDTIYFVVTKTKRYSIYKKTENFDDEFIVLKDNMAAVNDFFLQSDTPPSSARRF